MAKMFYTMQETMATLNRNEEGIKQLAREGRLREFRDGPRLMFKADQVEQLKGELGGGGGSEVPLSAESGAPLSLAGDSRTGSSAGGISLSDTSGGSSALGSRAGTAGGTAGPKEDTHFADIGLSGSLGGSLGGSVGGIPSPSRGSGSGAPVGSGSGILNLGGSGSSSGLGPGSSRGGITVFDVDESQRVDPSAQTAVNTGVQDQINLEGVGSGSGLLDLTRESDDTSLGAVFDELTPGARRAGAAAPTPISMESQTGSEAGIAGMSAGPMRGSVAAPIFVEAADPMAVGLGWGAALATAILIFGGFILAAALLGHRPDILTTLDWNKGQGMLAVAAAFLVTIIFTVIGFVVGKMGSK